MKILDKRELIAKWLKEYAEQANVKGYVVGLSGGVDSTCAAALAVEAVGKENVYGVSMPCTLGSQKSRGQDIDDAILVAKILGIECQVVHLNTAAEEMIGTTGVHVDMNSILVSNMKARLRAITLRMLTEEKHYLVLGTTNRTEDVLGYFTKGGDGGSGIDVEPIAHLYKYEVREMVKSFGFPDALVNRVPSAGLFDDQTDEGELGVKYSQLDALFELMDDLHSHREISMQDSDYLIRTFALNHFGFTEQQLHDIYERIYSTKHKRKLAPTIKL